MTETKETVRKKTKVSIGQDGTIRFIYDDKFKPFIRNNNDSERQPQPIKRASHVEPREDGWYADLSPVGGPELGPFDLRSDALAEEVKWLEENHI
jgi:hypothetical protein